MKLQEPFHLQPVLGTEASAAGNPLVGKQDGCPAIGIAIFAQTAGSRESHMRTRNENLPVNESSQQFVPRGYRRSRVDVEGNTDLRMFQLDALGMNDVTPE